MSIDATAEAEVAYAHRVATLHAKVDRFRILDEREGFEDNLSDFVASSWRYIDSAQYQRCWAIDAVCDHLEAVTTGAIRFLAINQPPRTAKTMTASVCWNAWTWARENRGFCSGPQVKFLCGSYNAPLSLMSSNKTRRLILSPWYQRYWGDRFYLRQDQNSKSNFENTENGARISTSVKGSLLGLGGDVICFPYWQEVQTERGSVKIGELVEKRECVRVWSLNLVTGNLELQPVTGWHKNPARHLVKILLSDGSTIECTEDHQILTTKGYLPAASLHSGCRLATAPSRMLVPSTDVALTQFQAEVRPTVAPPDVIDCRSADAVFLRKHGTGFKMSSRDLAHQFFRQVRRTVAECAMHFAVGNILRSRPIMEIGQSWLGAVPVFVPYLLPIWARADKCFHDNLVAKTINRLAIDPHRDARIPLVQDRRQNTLFESMMSAFTHPREALDPAEVRDRISGRCFDHGAPIFVDRVDSIHSLPSATYCLSVRQNRNMMIRGGGSSLCCKNCVDDPHNTETEKVVESDADRLKVASWWQEISSTRMNDPKQTAIVVTMQRLHEQDLSGIILNENEKSGEWVHLCYDGETEILTRDGWVRFPDLRPDTEVMAVDPATLEARWERPTRYVRERHRGRMLHFKSDTADLMVTPDHRVVYGDPNDMNGGKCARWRVRPAADLPENWYLPQVVNWDGDPARTVSFAGQDWGATAFAEFMGWYLSEGCANAKRRTTRIVQSTNGRHVMDIDRVMAVIPFHAWRSRHRDGMLCWHIKNRHLAAALAPLGKSLDKRAPDILKAMRPAELRAFLLAYARGDGHFAVRNPKKISITTASRRMADDLQECAVKAGWAASLSVRKDSYSVYIRASKAKGCERKIASRIRRPNTRSVDYDGDVYCVSVPSTAVLVRRNGRVAVSGNCLPMHFDERRRSVTVILPQYDDPEPWTDPRTVDGELLWKERFGEPEIERLESRLGPYMASGRLEQSPSPKGGGIIKDFWWQPWDMQEARLYGLEWGTNRKEFPPFELVVGSLDASYGMKQENDFNAYTVWGLWIDRKKNRRAMLMYAINKRLPLHGKVISAKSGEAKVNFMQRQQAEWGLVEWIADINRRYKVRRMLIENKSRGPDVANEINLLYAREQWGVELVDPVGDKVSRTHAIVPLFTDDMIYAPDTKWAQMVIDQCKSFPKSEHDDLVDSTTQFLKWGRDAGLLVRADEADAQREDDAAWKGQQESVADQYGVGGR